METTAARWQSDFSEPSSALGCLGGWLSIMLLTCFIQFHHLHNTQKQPLHGSPRIGDETMKRHAYIILAFCLLTEYESHAIKQACYKEGLLGRRIKRHPCRS